MLRLARPVLQSYNLPKMLKALISSLFIGFLTGSAVSFLIGSLSRVSLLRLDHPDLIFGLPVAGVMIALLHQQYGEQEHTDTELLRQSLSSASRRLSPLFAPAIWASTCLTHLTGGSAGREGAAFQIAGGIARILPGRFLGDRGVQREILLSSMAAGFAAALGAPASGLLFAWEFSGKWKLGGRLPLLMVITVTSALVATECFRTEHLIFPRFRLESNHSAAALLGASLLATVPFTGLGLTFERLLFVLRRFLLKRLPSPRVRAFGGGLLLLAAFSLFDSKDYQGLGVEPMIRAFSEPSDFQAPLVKLLLTVITLASGFKGGEFIPLFFIGSTAGSALIGAVGASLIPSGSFGGASRLIPALGCVTVYGIASRSPATALALAVELFGIDTLPFAAISIGVGAWLAKKARS